jgi:hypothetical protein
MAKRTTDLDREIRESLSRISKKPGLKTREQLDAEIDAILAGGLPAERYEIAQALGFRYPKRPPTKKMTITGTNIFALADLVREHGGHSTFSNRMHSGTLQHIKRTLTAGLVEVSSPTTLTLTPEGREAVLRELRSSYRGKRDVLARDPSRFSQSDLARLEQLRTALENLEAGG